MIGALVLVAVALVVAVAVGGWRLWCLHHAVRRMDRELDAQLDRFWHEILRLHGEHRRATESRMRRVEAVVTQQGHGHEDLVRRVAWMERWVQHWVAQLQERRT